MNDECHVNSLVKKSGNLEEHLALNMSGILKFNLHKLGMLDLPASCGQWRASRLRTIIKY